MNDKQKLELNSVELATLEQLVSAAIAHKEGRFDLFKTLIDDLREQDLQAVQEKIFALIDLSSD